MKYLLLAALIISCFAISCDEDKDLLETKTETALEVHDQDEIQSILSSLNNNSRALNNPSQHFLIGSPLNFVDDFGTVEECGNSSNSNAPCGTCQGICTDGLRTITGTYQNGNVLSPVDYNDKKRLYTLTVITHRQTGEEKLIFDTKYINDFFNNGRLNIGQNWHLSSQMAARLGKQQVRLKSGRYAMVVDPVTNHGVTIIDLQ